MVGQREGRELRRPLRKLPKHPRGSEIGSQGLHCSGENPPSGDYGQVGEMKCLEDGRTCSFRSSRASGLRHEKVSYRDLRVPCEGANMLWK